MGEFLGGVPDAVWGGLALVGAALVTAWFTNRGKKPETTSSFIDDLMKRLETVEATATRTQTSLDEERKARKADGAEAQRRERVVLDYVESLRRHISDGLPPPPPAWPDELTRFRGEGLS